MKHASAEALNRLDEFLEAIRDLGGLKEKSRGVFYLKSQAFLHFHEDDGALFADVRLSGLEFDRFRVVTAAERKSLLAKIRRKVT